jgi:site-specific DNA-methyltransferase (adenine-specific)
MDTNKIYRGDCVEIMKTFPGNTFDAIVTDPPYFLKFMSKAWDTIKTHDKPKSNSIYPKSRNVDGVRVGAEKGAAPEMQDWHYKWAVEALRVAKPGAHMLVFGGTRTHHRLMVGVEDAGWEIKDTVMYVYGVGFPKSRDVWKNDICPEIERQLKEQGVVGVIEWK